MSSEFNYVLLLAQSETERLLTEQLNRQGVKVERGVELLTVTQRQDSVSAVVRSGDGAQEVVDASYLIAADGSHSAIRKALGLPFTGRSLTHNYVLGDLQAGRASTPPRCRLDGRNPSGPPDRDGRPSHQTWCRRTSS
jgi:2-polyprenyl-6-methoxyphenol hydroxylase-like FAD-dependent oxidoreductase